MNKQAVRADMKAFLAAMNAEDRHERSVKACKTLIATREFRHAHMLMIFLSMPSEIETTTLALSAWQECKSVAVPRVDWGHHKMEPVEIRSLEVGLRTVGPGQGMREPIEGTAVPLGMIDVIVIPGLAFDRHGYRVGRGRGFYDRFLAQQEFEGIRIGLCFHEQLLAEAIPNEAHDIPMDLIVTDRELVHVHQDGRHRRVAERVGE